MKKATPENKTKRLCETLRTTSLGYDTIIILMFTRLTKNYYRNTNGMYCIVFGFTYFCQPTAFAQFLTILLRILSVMHNRLHCCLVQGLGYNDICFLCYTQLQFFLRKIKKKNNSRLIVFLTFGKQINKRTIMSGKR